MKNNKEEGQIKEEKLQEKTRKAKKRRRIFRKTLLILLLVLVLGIGGWMGFLKLRQEYTVTYQEYSTTTGTISNALSFSGTLQATNNKTYTASSAGTVRRVSVRREQEVREGDELVRLSNGQIIKAEFDGRVNVLSAEEGEKVAAGDELVQIVDFEHMMVSVRIDEYDISDVHAGDACRITTVATEKTFESTVDEINYVSASSGSVAYYTANAYVDVSGGVYPGMQVTVTVPKEEARDVVILQEAALSFDLTNQAFVFTRTEDGDVEQTYVKTGVSNGNYVEIREGLKAGETVYVVVETTTDSLTTMLSSIFGTRQFNTRPNQNWNRNNTNNRNTNNPGNNNINPNNNNNGNRPANFNMPGGGGR